MPFARIFPTIVLLAAMVGCTSRDPLEQVVSAPTLSRFAAWRAHIASDSGAETRVRVEQALHEIRLGITGERELRRQMEERVVSGTEVIDEAVRQKVDGRRLRDVLRIGFETRVRRLKEELAGLEDAVNKNARLVTKPGDLESRHHLEGLHERQSLWVTKYREDIAAAERELAALGK